LQARLAAFWLPSPKVQSVGNAINVRQSLPALSFSGIVPWLWDQLYNEHEEVISMTARRAGGVPAGALVLLAVTAWPAQAYLDPGTGSMILQGIIGVVGGALVAVRIYWNKIKLLFSAKSTADSVEDRDSDTN
jgi:hypothetical protein